MTRDLARCMRCASTSSYSGDDRRDATLGVAGVSSGVPGEPEPAPRPLPVIFDAAPISRSSDAGVRRSASAASDAAPRIVLISGVQTDSESAT